MWEEGYLGIPYGHTDDDSPEVVYYTAKVYDEPSKYGINGGRVSKLAITTLDNELIANYDRGWDIYPATKTAEVAVSLIVNMYV